MRRENSAGLDHLDGYLVYNSLFALTRPIAHEARLYRLGGRCRILDAHPAE
jgi:hypothetical protein